MTVSEFHILVEQDVQKISSFAYTDMLPEEVDIQANKTFYLWLNDFATYQPRGNRIDDTEARLNDIRTLIVRDSSLSLVATRDVSVASFPENYLYLVGIEMQVLYECSTTRQTSIVEGSNYILKSASLTYNAINYTKGQLIVGTSTYILGKSDIVYKLSERTSYGRIVRGEEANKLNDTYYGKTNKQSPLVSVSSTGIVISTKNRFFIDTAKAIYIKAPRKINSNNPDDEIELPINGAYKLAQLTVESILKVTEQSQQKIENLKLTK